MSEVLRVPLVNREDARDMSDEENQLVPLSTRYRLSPAISRR
jgi:hypothetical protein